MEWDVDAEQWEDRKLCLHRFQLRIGIAIDSYHFRLEIWASVESSMKSAAMLISGSEANACLCM